MSIYATWLLFDDSNHTASCARWCRVPASRVPSAAERMGRGWMARGDGACFEPVPDAGCTCGEKPPLIYQGSHVSPSGDDARGGSVEFAAIPDCCHPSAWGWDGADGELVDFARLSVRQDPRTWRHGEEAGTAAVVLGRAQVRKLRDALTAWLDAEERA